MINVHAEHEGLKELSLWKPYLPTVRSNSTTWIILYCPWVAKPGDGEFEVVM